MTYSKSKIAGLSVADAIGVICAAVTDASRWASFRDRINLSDRQTIHIGGEYGGGVVDLGGSEPQKTQYDIDVEAYAAALQHMVNDLVAGELVADCRAIASGAGSKSFHFPVDGWEDGWQLIVDGKSAILVDGEGTKYKLLSLQAANVPPPRVVVDAVANEEMSKAARLVRGPTTEYEPVLVMMETLIVQGKASGPWNAASMLWDKGTIKKGTTEKDSILKKFSGAYKKSGRQVKPPVRKNVSATQE